MSTVIAMQNIRTSLASIARRAEAGEQFLVVRNSRPSFYILPANVNEGKKSNISLNDITGKIDKSKASKSISRNLVDEIIHEIHGETVL